jgi:hypothetical protein
MAKKKDALTEIILAFDDVVTPDMSAADCIHAIAGLVADFVADAGAAITAFDARIKALEDKG